MISSKRKSLIFGDNHLLYFKSSRKRKKLGAAKRLFALRGGSRYSLEIADCGFEI